MKLVVNKLIGISQQGAGQFITNGNLLLNNFSFSHFSFLLTVEESIKRYFYEQQAIKNNLSAKQLERQIK